MAGTSVIEAYLEQLRVALPQGFEADDVIAEVEDHLRTIVETHVSLGLSEEAATAHALGVFGSAELVARAFAQQKKKGGAAMPTMFTRMAGAAALVGGPLLAACMVVGSVTDLDVGNGSGWFAPMAAAGAVLALIGVLGVHVRHRAVYGAVGRTARWLVPAGLLTGAASGLAWFDAGVLASLILVVIGVFGLGFEAWRAGVIQRSALTIVGVALAALPPLSAISVDASRTWTAQTVASMIAFVALGAGVTWFGTTLWRERADLGSSTGGRSAAA